jgi:hypothetical protein
MHPESYDFKIGLERHGYAFYSDGPKGKIKKIVLYDRFVDVEGKTYSLAFGDRNGNSDRIDHLAVSNNQDREKILTTVAATALYFTEENPNAVLCFVGSTPARTRLYQMRIASQWDEIASLFDVKGLIEGNWEPFRKGQNYDAFLLKRK